jgi:hypothetical protein
MARGGSRHANIPVGGERGGARSAATTCRRVALWIVNWLVARRQT